MPDDHPLRGEIHELWEASPVAMLYVDRDGIIRRANQAAVDVFGYPREELVDRSVDMLIPEAARDRHGQMRRDFADQPSQRRMGGGRDLYAQHADGTLFAVEVGLSPMAGGAIAVVADIEARKRAELAVLEMTEELIRSNRELEQFAYVVSHDLQSPLRMVTSFMDLLAKRHGDNLDEEALRWVEFARNGAERMKKQLDAILDMSRLGRRGTPFTDVALDDVVREAREILLLEDATFTCKPLPIVRGDRDQLLRVFQNLIGNAGKYRREVPLEIHISAKRHDAQWRVFVRDNGIGIDPAQSERIFLPFQRLHEADAYEGTGMGLAIVTKIMKLHTGYARVTSTPGEGSTFILHFPVPRDAESIPPRSRRSPKPGPGAPFG